MNKKYLYLTVVTIIPTEQGQAKIKKAESNTEKRDINGNNLEWYADQNLRPPKELLENDEPEIDEDGQIELTKGEFEYDFHDCLVEASKIVLVLDDTEIGSYVYVEGDFKVRVAETAEEINALLWFMNRSRTERFKDWWDDFKNKFKRKPKEEEEPLTKD